MSLNQANLFSVHGLVAVVTGGGSGLGRAMALALATNGAARVFVLGRRERPLLETVAEAPAGIIIPVICDITSRVSLEAAYGTVAAQTTHIDLLIANSGIGGPKSRVPKQPDGSPATLEQFREFHWSQPMEDFEETLNVNVTGTHYTIMAFLPLLHEANKRRPAPEPGKMASARPQVIVISSMGAFVNQPVGFAYSCSKAALNQLVPALASYLSPYHIRVNGIAPGLIPSEMSGHLLQTLGVRGSGLEDGSVDSQEIPVTRVGGAEDIAGMVMWMASRSGGYLNGEMIVVDGGRSKVVL